MLHLVANNYHINMSTNCELSTSTAHRYQFNVLIERLKNISTRLQTRRLFWYINQIYFISTYTLLMTVVDKSMITFNSRAMFCDSNTYALKRMFCDSTPNSSYPQYPNFKIHPQTPNNNKPTYITPNLSESTQHAKSNTSHTPPSLVTTNSVGQHVRYGQFATNGLSY